MLLFGEPARTQYDLNFVVFGVPVRVHPLFWLVALLFGSGGNPEPGAMVIWVGVVFLSVLVHELGHALTARHFGAQPWITLQGFGGLASYSPAIRGWQKNVLILLAGPGAGFLLAVVVWACIVVTGTTISVYLGDLIGTITLGTADGRYVTNIRLAQLIRSLVFVNIFWGIINLLPVYPLDGGQISRQVFTALNPWQGMQRSLMLSILAGGLLCLWGIQSGDIFIAMFFGYLAFLSYQMLQGSGGIRRW